MSWITARFKGLHLDMLKDTFIYTASSVVNALIALILLPFFTRFLSPAQFGMVETFGALCNFFTVVFIFGGNIVIMQEFYGGDADTRRTYISNVLIVNLAVGAIALALGGILMCFGDSVEAIIKIKPQLIVLAVVFSLLDCIVTIVYVILQLRKKAGRYALLVNGRTLFEISTSLLFVGVLCWNWQGRVAGVFSGALFAFVVAMFVLRGEGVDLRKDVSRQHLQTVVRKGSVLMISQVASWGIEMVNKLLIAGIVSMTETGYFSIGLRFGMVVMIIEASFSRAWSPFFFENIDKDPRKVKVAMFTYLVALLLFAMTYAVLAKYMLRLVVDKRFLPAERYIPYFALAYFFDGTWKTFNSYLIKVDKYKLYSAIVVASSLLNIAVSLLLLPRIGALGACFAILISFGFGALTTIVCSYRYASKYLLHGAP